MFTNCISRGGNAVSLVQSIPLFLLHWTKWLMIFIFVKCMGHDHSLLGIEVHRSALSVWPWSIAEIYMAVAPYGLQCFDVPRFIFCSIYHKLFVCFHNFPTYFFITYFLSYLLLRTGPFRFQARHREMSQNLVVVFCVHFVFQYICYGCMFAFCLVWLTSIFSVVC